jgi:DNA-binding MarR family transcriptional regulator
VRVLYEQPSLEPRQIVELCRISSPSMAGVLSRMEQLGLVARRRLPHDQRRVLVSLTARARAMAARMAPQIDATYRRIERQVGAEFNVQLQQALDRLLAMLTAHVPLRRTRAARRVGGRQRRRSAGGPRTRSAVQQKLSEGRSYEQA